MSEEFKDSRDKDGFLKCKECPRRFLTKLAFENHSSNQHNQEIETKLDQLPQPPTVKYPSACSMCYLSFQSETEVQQHRISAHETPLKCNLCKKSFSSNWALQRHIDIVHKKLKPFQCPQCKIYFGQKVHKQLHINTVHKKLKPFQCQQCKIYFGRKSHVQYHISTTHENLKPFQ